MSIIPEKLMEDLIADYPHEFIEDGLTLIERQSAPDYYPQVRVIVIAKN